MTGLTVAQVLSQNFNGRVEWGVPGSYIKILTAAANLQLEAFKGGVCVLLAPIVKAGFYQRVEFDRIVVTNTGAQLTEILVAPDQGGSDAFTANSVITSPLDADNADGAAALGANGLVAVAARLKAFNGATYDRLRLEQLISRYALRVSEQGFSYGASASSIAANAANTPVALVAPGTNTNGLILWAGGGYGRNAAGPAQQMTLLAKSSAPVAINDGDVLSEPTGLTELAAAGAMAWRVARPTLVSAGKGVYKMNFLAEANQYCSILYTLL